MACRAAGQNPESWTKDWHFLNQNPSIKPPYKIARKQLKVSISPIAQGFPEISRLQHEALTVQTCPFCITILNNLVLHGKSSRLVPGDSNLKHHTYRGRYAHSCIYSCIYYSCIDILNLVVFNCSIHNNYGGTI